MAKQPRPILVMGTGQALRMGDISMREQVAKYLHRLRFTLPFPCTPDETYFGCVPDAIRKWHDDGLFGADAPSPGKASNLLHTMFQSPFKNILHVCVESQEEYVEAIRGVRGFEKVFWFRAPSYVPLPSNSPFFLNNDHPHVTVLREWAAKAFELEDDIQRGLKLAEAFAAVAKTPAAVRYAWPELLHFVTFKRGLERADGRSNLRAARAIRPTDKEHLIELLTTAAMLPEKNPPLAAWVNFYTGEEEENG